MAARRRGRPRRHPPPSPAPPPPHPISVGNCTVEVEGSGFTCEPQGDGRFLISTTGAVNVRISAVEGSGSSMARKPYGNLLSGLQPHDGGDEPATLNDHSFVVLNSRDIDSRNKSLMQEVLRVYMEELPNMNYAANTGKQSSFLEKCVSGKYKTLILKSNTLEGPGEVIAAVSYQIVPSDMQYAEIPLAAVSSGYQRKGIGHLLYSELRNRLQNVGILTIFCWADKESEGFWLKQGFASIGDVDGRGRVRKLPVRADIRKALCFPGDSTLMVTHLKREAKCLDRSHAKICFPVYIDPDFVEVGKDQNILNTERLNLLDPQGQQNENAPVQLAVKPGCLAIDKGCTCFPSRSITSMGCTNMPSGVGDSETAENVHCYCNKHCSHLRQTAKRHIWEASLSSIKSKRVKGGHLLDRGMVSECGSDCEHDRGETLDSRALSLDQCEFKSLACSLPRIVHPHVAVHSKDMAVQNSVTEDLVINGLVPKGKRPNIMFMNIADENKKTCLSKIVEELGGSVTPDGSLCTHVITGKAMKTLNFCTALCSGAWILSSSWLKESYREGKFIGESNFILEDVDYAVKYKSALKDAVVKARAEPRSLLKGYCVCLAKHIQPPADVLSVIIKSAGGHVIHRMDNVLEPSKAIFIACEEDMEEAMLAAKRGIWTYSTDWFMSCIMRQELDFEAPQFAESL